MTTGKFSLFLESPPQNDWIACGPTRAGVPGMGWNPVARFTKETLLSVYHYIEARRSKKGPPAYEIMLKLYEGAARELVARKMTEMLTERLLTGEITDDD